MLSVAENLVGLVIIIHRLLLMEIQKKWEDYISQVKSKVVGKVTMYKLMINQLFSRNDNSVETVSIKKLLLFLVLGIAGLSFSFYFLSYGNKLQAAISYLLSIYGLNNFEIFCLKAGLMLLIGWIAKKVSKVELGNKELLVILILITILISKETIDISIRLFKNKFNLVNVKFI